MIERTCSEEELASVASERTVDVYFSTTSYDFNAVAFEVFAGVDNPLGTSIEAALLNGNETVLDTTL